MDLVLYEDGETHTLADVESGGLDEAQALEWFRQLCSALAYVHAQGIVHRDIKLNSILLAPDGRVARASVSRVATKVPEKDEVAETSILVLQLLCASDAF